MAIVVKNLPANAGDTARNAGSIPALGRFPGRQHGNPFQHSCLENPMDRGACCVIVHGVTKESGTTEGLNTTHMLWEKLRGLPLLARGSLYSSHVQVRAARPKAICKCPLHLGDLISKISCCFKTLSLHMHLC